MLNVLIAEDDIPISIQLSNTINTDKIRCIGILNEGIKVVQKIKELKPDVLILDLKLPGKSGIDILKEVQEDKTIKTRIIIYSGEIEYMSIVRKYDFVYGFYSKITPKQEIARILENMYEEIYNKNTGDKIVEILFDLGFSYSLKGTRLINDCILYSILKKEDNIKNIYCELSKQRGENVYTIKSDINTAINSMWRFTDKNIARKILRLGDYDKPSCKAIVSMVKYYVEK